MRWTANPANDAAATKKREDSPLILGRATNPLRRRKCWRTMRA
jgi:hypothetical protein